MDRLKVLLAVKPPLLSNTLRILLAQHPKLNVIDAGIDDVAILVEARRQRVDVVVATFEPTSDVPPLVPLLLVEFPEVRVIGIDLRNQCARIYATHSDVRIIPDLTVSGMIDAILSGRAKPGETGED